MKCPRHHSELQKLQLDHAAVFACPRCGGRAVSVPLLRRLMPAERSRELWTRVRKGRKGDVPCPSCERPARRASLGHGRSAVDVDGCEPCLLIWFDAGELQAIAPRADKPRPVADAPVPADSGATWFWNSFFQRLNEPLHAPQIRAAEAIEGGDLID